MKNRLLLTIFSLFLFGFAYSQQVVTGIVREAGTNAPMIGVTIQEKDSDRGTVTDYDGRFSLTLTTVDPVLIFRYTGYETVEVNLGGRSDVEVSLSESAVLIDQIVVVGYGIQKKSDLTGAVSSVKGEDVARVATGNVEQALQGKISGVYVAPASGTPGAGAVIRIRGTGTLNNANPLYVIDGMITYDASFVNPEDVQSIEVLKDASAAAIYGSRGANGVIIITTKSGIPRERAIISAGGFYGVQSIARKIDLLNAAEFAAAYNELRNQQHFADPASLGEGTDWQDVIFREAPMYNATVSANGGGEKFSYNFSANYFSQDGIVESSHYDRLTLRFNAEYELHSNISLGHNIAYANIRQQLSPDVINNAYRMPPVYAERDSTGDFSDPTFFGLAVANPAADLFYKSNNNHKGNRLFGNLYVDVGFLKHFTFRSNFGLDRGFRQGIFYEPVFEVSASQRNLNDRLSVSQNTGNEWIWEQTLTYDRTWNDHHVTVLAGYTAEERAFEGLGGSRENFPGTAEEILYLSSGNDTTQMNFHEAVDEAMVSNLFRVNYTLKEKYLLTLTWRTDRSSRFTSANRTGHFPSGSVGWNIGAEPFMAGTPWIDRMKIRASYGVLGNQAAARAYPSTGAVTSGLYGVFGSEESLHQGATLISLSNANLQWETSRQADIGLDLSLFDGRMEFEIDWYDRLTYDIIASVPIPDYVGSQDDPVVNTAEVKNTGWDILANYRSGSKFAYHIGAILSPVSNNVEKLAEGRSEIFAAFLQGEPATHTIVGLPIGSFFGYQVAGIFQTEEELAAAPKLGGERVGDLRFADTNGDGVLNGDDRVYLGSPIPTLTYSLSAGFDWNGLDFNIDFVGATGHKIFNAKETFRFAVYNYEQHVADRWTATSPSLTEPRISNGGHNFRVSDFFLEDASFVRLRSMTLGYSLPATLLTKAKMNTVRVYVTGNNIWTSQSYSGYSPEFPNGSNAYEVGFDFGSYPVARSWIGGIEIKF